MRIKSLLITVFGVALAGGSVFMAKEFLQGPIDGAAIAAPSADMVDVIVAQSTIEFGQPVDGLSIKTLAWPREAVPVGAYTSPQEIVGSGVAPRRALTRIYAGEILLESKLSQPGERVTIVQKLGANNRAMAISVNASTAVGGFVTPGDFVDIVMTQGGGDQQRAGTILQAIRVIGVDQQSEDSADQPAVARTITVEVTPDQGQRLALAQRVGLLSLTLRGLDDSTDETLALVEMGDLFNEPVKVADVTAPEVAPEIAPVAVVRRPSITVRRGTTSEVVQLK